jgi:phosphatidate phosphatase PAH1
MDLESMTLFLAKKDFGAIEIQTESNRDLGADNITDSTMTRYLRKRSFAEFSQRPPPTPEIEGAGPLTTQFCKDLTKSLSRHFVNSRKEP